jgi:hypothetical protein
MVHHFSEVCGGGWGAAFPDRSGFHTHSWWRRQWAALVEGQKGSWFDNGQSPFENRGFVGIAPLKSPHELADAGGRAHREAIRQPTIRDAGCGL